MRIKKSLLIVLVTTFFILSSTLTASAAVSTTDLTNALNSAGISDTGLIIEYLQTFTITDAQAAQVKANVDAVNAILNGQTVDSLSAAQKTQVASLITDSAKLLQMNVQFVDNSGNPVNLATFTSATTGGLKLNITKSNGALLATVDPKAGDLNAGNLSAMTTAFKTAADEAKSYTVEFQAENGGKLAKTGSDFDNKIFLAIGIGLVAIGALSYKPLRKLAR